MPKQNKIYERFVFWKKEVWETSVSKPAATRLALMSQAVSKISSRFSHQKWSGNSMSPQSSCQQIRKKKLHQTKFKVDTEDSFSILTVRDYPVGNTKLYCTVNGLTKKVQYGPFTII